MLRFFPVSLLLISLICTPAMAKRAESSWLTAEIPDNWDSQERRGVFLIGNGPIGSGSNLIEILTESGRSESLDALVREHGTDFTFVSLANGRVIGFAHASGRTLAAKGNKGLYIEISVEPTLFPNAPAIIKSLKANDKDLEPALSLLARDDVLSFLR